jgi:hypothetical protein
LNDQGGCKGVAIIAAANRAGPSEDPERPTTRQTACCSAGRRPLPLPWTAAWVIGAQSAHVRRQPAPANEQPITSMIRADWPLRAGISDGDSSHCVAAVWLYARLLAYPGPRSVRGWSCLTMHIWAFTVAVVCLAACDEGLSRASSAPVTRDSSAGARPHGPSAGRGQVADDDDEGWQIPTAGGADAGCYAAVSRRCEDPPSREGVAGEGAATDGAGDAGSTSDPSSDVISGGAPAGEAAHPGAVVNSGGTAGAAGPAADGGRPAHAGSAGAGGSAASTAGSAGAAGAGSSVHATCEGGKGRIWSGNGHCYFPVASLSSWNVSRDLCLQNDAQLVTITSAAEQSFVATLVGSSTRWIGFSKFGAPAFAWISGEPVSFTNWQSGEPNATGDAAVTIQRGSLLWSDEAVSTRHSALCERS